MKATKISWTKWVTRSGAALLGSCLIVGDLAWAASPTVPAAGPKNDLAISLTAKKVVRQTDGKEKLVPAERAFPGEVIQYDALYLNRSDKSLTRIAPTLPIPNGMIFVPDSASPVPTEASLDGKTFQAIPIRRQVTMPNGEVKEQEVPATEYRALRWNVDHLAAGAQTIVTARTKLVPVGNQ